jgi:hypothetical protein
MSTGRTTVPLVVTCAGPSLVENLTSSQRYIADSSPEYNILLSRSTLPSSCISVYRRSSAHSMSQRLAFRDCGYD